ncbi:MAG: efflux RND transporter periplasmic adaptor subunit [Desulfobulbaceae bacterium]|jgi:HlyD family secretion protein|nr:efflux RND transporter periplasmic adaptor subunit [Desulfobulbaceae bacterium]
MSRERIIGLALILAMAAVALFAPSRTPPEETDVTAKVARRDLQARVDVIGALDAAQAHMIASELQGTEGRIAFLVEDGARAQKNDLLVRLDPAPFQRLVEQYRAEAEGLKAAVWAAEQGLSYEKNQVRQEIESAEYSLNVAKLELKKLQEGDGPLQASQFVEEEQKARIELQRHEEYLRDLLALAKDGFENVSELAATKEKLEAVRKRFEAAAGRTKNFRDNVFPAMLEAARAKEANAAVTLESGKQGGIFRVARAEATLSQVKSKLAAQEAQLQRAEAELAKTEIRAPFAGIVIQYEAWHDREKRKPRVGDSVVLNQPILYLPDISKMIVRSQAREIDLFKLAVGQKATITVDAYPDSVFSGELNFIGALAAAENGQDQEKYFQVTFLVDESDKRLRPGMTCRVAILAQSAKNALTVPLAAIFYRDNQPFCHVRGAFGGFREQPVKLGAQTDDFAQITEGLQEGQIVSLVRPAARAD